MRENGIDHVARTAEGQFFVVPPGEDADFIRSAGYDMSLARISTYRDVCGLRGVNDYLVPRSMDKGEREIFACEYLRTIGWQCGTSGDFCLDHKEVPRD